MSHPLEKRILRILSHGRDSDVSDREFGRLALDIFDFQYRQNKDYRALCDFERKTPGHVSEWKDIPAMPAIGFKELRLTTFPVKKSIQYFKTSGTTLKKSGIHYFKTLKLYEEAILPPFEKAFMREGRLPGFYFLISSPMESPHSSLSYMMGVLNRKFPKSRGKYYVKNGKLLFEILENDLRRAKNPVLLLSTALALMGFLEHLKGRHTKLSLPKGSCLMETGGFKGRVKSISKEALYSGCEKYLGIPKNQCIGEYGMTELSSQCYGNRVFHGPSWMRTLVMDAKTGKEVGKGKTGLLRHFDLANLGSVLAIQTEDLGRAVGDGFEVLGRASSAELRGCSLSYEQFLKS